MGGGSRTTVEPQLRTTPRKEGIEVHARELVTKRPFSICGGSATLRAAQTNMFGFSDSPQYFIVIEAADILHYSHG